MRNGPMNKLVRVMCVVLGLAVAAGSAAALENGKQCAKAPEKAEKAKAAVPGRTPISKDPWTPADAQDKVVYGTDDRIDVYQETDPLRLDLAGSVCGLVDTSDLTPISGGAGSFRSTITGFGGFPPVPGSPSAASRWCPGARGSWWGTT